MSMNDEMPVEFVLVNLTREQKSDLGLRLGSMACQIGIFLCGFMIVFLGMLVENESMIPRFSQVVMATIAGAFAAFMIFPLVLRNLLKKYDPDIDEE
jgi:hypothetical protein